MPENTTKFIVLKLKFCLVLDPNWHIKDTLQTQPTI